jgi:hypothetical protein
VILAGGRISGLYARAAGTKIKGLAPVAGSPVVRRAAESLLAAPGIDRVCVVGPVAVREALPDGCLWQDERESALGNIQAGVERLDAAGAWRILVCGTDVPVVRPASIQDFLERTPPEAEIGMPIVRKEAFVRAFPGDLGIYVRLAEGAFTAGCQFLLRPAVVLDRSSLLHQLHTRRKSQLAMARIFGGPVVWKLITGRLSVPELEARASELTGCRCAAVMDCSPDLAFDIDSVLDLRYIEKWLRRASR